MKYRDENLAQNMENSIRLLEKEMSRQSPIPKEFIEKTDFFHRSERIHWMILKILNDIHQRMKHGNQIREED